MQNCFHWEILTHNRSEMKRRRIQMKNSTFTRSKGTGQNIWTFFPVVDKRYKPDNHRLRWLTDLYHKCYTMEFELCIRCDALPLANPLNYRNIRRAIVLMKSHHHGYSYIEAFRMFYLFGGVVCNLISSFFFCF